MTTSLGGVHVDVTISIREVGRTLATELRKAGREAGREAEKEFGDSGRRAGQAFNRNVAEVVTRERSGRLWAERFGRGVLTSLSAVRALGGALARVGAITAGLGLGALASQAAIGGIVTLAAELSNLAGVAGLIPAVFTAASAAIATLTIGFQGIGEVLKADTPEKFNEAIKNLSPNARAAAVAVKGLGDQARALRLSVQDALFAGFSDVIQRLGSTYLPIARRGFTALATEINRGAKAFADVALEQQSIADTGTVFDGLRQTFANLVPAATNVARAIRDIVTVGVGELPGLAGRFTELTRRFADFIANARESGALQEFFAAGLNAARQLITILGNVGSALLSVFRAANESGGSVLGLIGELTGRLADFLKSAQGQESLSSFFTAASEAARVLLPIALELFDLFANVAAPILADIGTILGPAVTEIINALGTALEAAAPGIQALASGFAAFLNAMAPALPAIGQLAAALGTTLGQILTRIGPQLSQVVTIVSQNLAAAFSNPKLINGLISMAEVFGDILIAIAPLLPDLAELAGTILSALAKILAPIVEKLLPPLVELFSALLPVLEPLIDLVVALFDALSPIIDVIAFIIEVIGDLIGLLVDAAEGIGDLTDAALTFLTGVARETNLTKSTFNAFADDTERSFGRAGAAAEAGRKAMEDFAAGTVGSVGSAVTAVIDGSAEMNRSLSRNLEGVGQAAREAFGEITIAARKELERTRAVAASAIAGVRAEITRANFSAAGAGLIRSLADGMVSSAALAAVRSAARRAIEAVAAYLPSSPAKKGPFSGRGWTPYRGQKLVEGLAAGMAARASLLDDVAARLAASAAFSVTPTIPAVDLRPGSGRGSFPVLGSFPGAAGTSTTTTRTLNLEQHVHVPSTDPHAYAAATGVHLRAAASRVL